MCEPISDAALRITPNFVRIFDGSWVITNFIPPSCDDISETEGKIRGNCNERAWGDQELSECIKIMLIADSGRSEKITSKCI